MRCCGCAPVKKVHTFCPMGEVQLLGRDHERVGSRFEHGTKGGRQKERKMSHFEVRSEIDVGG